MTVTFSDEYLFPRSSTDPSESLQKQTSFLLNLIRKEKNIKYRIKLAFSPFAPP